MKKFIIVCLAAALYLAGCPSPTEPDRILPAVPSTPMINAGNGQLFVSWADVSDADSFDVYYNTTGDPPGVSARPQIPEEIDNEITIDGLDNGTTYYIWIRSRNCNGVSAWSSRAEGTPQFSTVTSVTDLNLTAAIPPPAVGKPLFSGTVIRRQHILDTIKWTTTGCKRASTCSHQRFAPQLECDLAVHAHFGGVVVCRHCL